MNIEIKRNAQDLVLEVVGRLDTTTAPVLDQTITENLEGVKSLVLDLKGLEYISSAGLRILLSTHKKMNGALTITNVCETVMDVLEMTGFADILVIE